jgi:UDP-N-acetyl-D-mannosaminuronic acid dehydrogenase
MRDILIKQKIAIIGGCGHIGLPLGLVLSELGHNVVAIDTNLDHLSKVNEGIMPFEEKGAADILRESLKAENFRATSDLSEIADTEVIVICIGTPVDEHLSPIPRIFRDLLESLKPFLKRGQLIVLRSTVYPGTTQLAGNILENHGVDVAFCPERIVQGNAILELKNLPHIVTGLTPTAVSKASRLFSELGEIVCGEVSEAEFAKLFLNTYRYIEFATTNQLYMIANEAGVDYTNILKLMKENYPRANKLPGPGLTAGPCLMKDTMQLVAYSQNSFSLGVDAFLVNEGLALYLVNLLKKHHGNLSGIKVGLLGMAFKADIDDIRDSLSYRVKKALELEGAQVLASDYNVTVDKTLVSEEVLLKESESVIICTPHKKYAELDFQNKTVIDPWNVRQQGTLFPMRN